MPNYDVMDVWVYQPDGKTLITPLGGLLDFKALDELEGVGGGSLTVAVSNPILQAYEHVLRYRNVVKVRIANKVVAAWWIKNREEVMVGSEGEAARAYTVSGPGLLQWFEDAVLHHEFHWPYSGTTRWFNWGSHGSAWFRSDEWTSPVKVRERKRPDHVDPNNPFRQLPRNWPDTGGASGQGDYAWWVWDRENADQGAPEGYMFFRQNVTVNEETPCTLYITAKGRFKVLVDGEEVLKITSRRAYRHTYTADFDLGPGEHIIAIRVRNGRDNFAGMIAVLLGFVDPDAPGIDGQLLTITGDSGWAGMAYPDHEPGWTAGELLATITNEAVDRGVTRLTYLDRDYSMHKDSSNVDWDDYAWSFDIGSTYLSVIEGMRDFDVDVAVDPDTITVSAWQPRGTDRTHSVFLTITSHIQEAVETVEYGIQNYFLVMAEDQWTQTEDEDSIADFGRIEGYVDLAQLSEKARDKVLNALLKKARIATKGYAGTFQPQDGNRPWVDFFPGDRVSVADDDAGWLTRKVVSIAVSMDQAGLPVYAVEFDGVKRDRINRLQMIIDTAGTAVGSVNGRARKRNRASTRNGGGGDPDRIYYGMVDDPVDLRVQESEPEDPTYGMFWANNGNV